jgi:translation initiation factor 2B subunit (eIF-2B alpha/beta/delta family)
MRYPRRSLEVLREVERDRRLGAIGLAVKALDAFKPLAEREGTSVSLLKGLTKRLLKTRPTMICVGNASAELCCRIMDKAKDGEVSEYILREAERMQKRLVLAKAAIADAFSQEVDRPIAVYTLSNSQTVLECLKRIRDRLEQVFVALSDPGHEGRDLSSELSKTGVRNLLVPDMAVGSIMPKVDVVLLGADAVLKDGSVVNKLGSNTAAKIAYLEGRRVYFVAEKVKVHPSDEELRLEVRFSKGEGYVPFFDVTPYGYVQKLICEDGELEPYRVRALADKYAELRRRVSSPI